MNRSPEHSAPRHHEKEATHEISREIERIHEKLEKEVSNKAEKSENLDIEAASQAVERYAVSSKEKIHTDRVQPSHHPIFVNKQLKDMAYSRTMTRVRKHLSLPSKALSQVVHSRLLDKPSELASKTVARPSGMLGGALAAAVGMSLLLWATRYYGYEFNYLLAGPLFIGGLFIGLGIEFMFKIARRR